MARTEDMMKGMLTPPAAAHALLFAAAEPLDKKRFADLLGIKQSELRLVLKALADSLQGSGVVLVETDAELELRTAPEASALVKKLRESELSRDLGKAGLETLAIVAYCGEGATRGTIDWVRGVNSSTSLRTLLMRGLIEGREDERDKRRIRYYLTTEALGHLGVLKREDLPRMDELSPALSAISHGGTATDAATPKPD